MVDVIPDTDESIHVEAGNLPHARAFVLSPPTQEVASTLILEIEQLKCSVMRCTQCSHILQLTIVIKRSLGSTTRYNRQAAFMEVIDLLYEDELPKT